MNTHTTAHKAKIRHLCFVFILSLHLVYGAVPGPCKHSVTEYHLLTLRHLIGNQLQSGCSITYSFTERQNLSEVCYIKATFPHILDLLSTHFRYETESDNYRYTSSMKNLIYDIYSNNCIPPINEEIENNPVRFARVYTTLPKVGLEKAEAVIKIYKNLVTKNDSPVDWNCGDEYAESYPESTTVFYTQKTAASPPRPSLVPVWRHQSGGSSTPGPVVKQGASHLVQNQPALTSPNPSATTSELFREETYSSRNEDFSNAHLSTIPNSLEETNSLFDSLLGLESVPASASSFHNTPSTELPSTPQRRTEPVLQSTTSQHSHQTFRALRSEWSTAPVLAKRSLDTRAQGMVSNVFSSLLQSWRNLNPSGIHRKDSHLDVTHSSPLAE